MLERNYRTFAALNNISLDETPIDEDEEMDVDSAPAAEQEEEWGGIMDVDEVDDTPSFFKEEADRIAGQMGSKTKSKKKKTRVAELVREKIRKVLEDDTELADERAGKCDENDFLRLLLAFNKEGIHFS